MNTNINKLIFHDDFMIYLINLLYESGIPANQVKSLAHDVIYASKAYDFATINLFDVRQPGILGEAGFDRKLLEWFVSTGGEYGFLKSEQSILLGGLKLCEQCLNHRPHLEEVKGHILQDFHKRAIACTLAREGSDYTDESLCHAFLTGLKEFNAYVKC